MKHPTSKLNHLISTLHRSALPSLTSCALLLGSSANALAQKAHYLLIPPEPTVSINTNTSLTPLQKAAKNGNTQAQYLLATRLLTGDGVAQNEYAALRLLRKAARKGHVESQFQLGLLYLESKTLPTDEDLAYQWINKAFENGHPAAGAVVNYILSGEEYSLGC